MAQSTSLAETSFQEEVGLLLRLDMSSGEPLARQLTRALRRAIVTTRILPGQMLSEQELAGTLGISRQPVREAIINLRDLGLIQVLPQRGTKVTRISESAFENARFTREAIECALVREAALNRDAAQIERLRAIAEQHRQSALAGDDETFFELDEEFHRQIARMAGRPTVWDAVEMVKAQMDRVRFLDIGGRISTGQNIEEHGRIVDAIAAGDPDAAAMVMARHLQAARKAIRTLRERSPDMFEDR